MQCESNKNKGTKEQSLELTTESTNKPSSLDSRDKGLENRAACHCLHNVTTRGNHHSFQFMQHTIRGHLVHVGNIDWCTLSGDLTQPKTSIISTDLDFTQHCFNPLQKFRTLMWGWNLHTKQIHWFPCVHACVHTRMHACVHERETTTLQQILNQKKKINS